MAAAERMAAERAKRLAKFIVQQDRTGWRGDGQPPPDAYLYDERPLREQIMESDEAQGWVLTRNSYGCVVLNSDRVMFIDIDLPSRARAVGCLGFLIAARQAQPIDDAEQIRQRVHEVVSTLEGMSARLYRTRAGFRVIVTSETADPASDLTQETLHAFGADQQYAKLCRTQQSFRARLTPKPWRCPNFGRPPARFPFASAEDARQFDRWLTQYNSARVGLAVCEFVESVGPAGAIAEEVAPIVEMHDRYTLSPGDPLA